MLASLRAPLLALLVAVPAILVLDPSPAAAQPAASVERQEAARTKAEQGLKLFGADRYQEAYEWFREADVLYHAPTISLYMARCLRKIGRLVEARAQYEKLFAEPVPRDAAPAFVEAHDAAKTELDALRKLVPTVEFAAEGAPAGAVTWTLDGKPTSADRRDIDPGNHTVEATVNGVKAVKAFTLAEGAHQKIDVSFGAEAGAQKPPPAGAPAPAAPLDAAATKGSIVPGAVLLGVGGVGLGVGAITGAMSLAKVNDVKSRCKAGVCLASDQAQADAGRTLGHVSTATFIIGGVAAAAGVVLVIVRPGGKAPAKSARALDLRAGLGSLDLHGRF